MFFAIQDLEIRKIHFDVVFQPGEIDLADPDLKQVSPLNARGVAELLNNTLGEIRLQGHLQTSLESICDRCLEPAGFSFDCDFDLYFRPVTTSPTVEDLELEQGETEISFYEGDGVQLEEALREHILLLLPMQKVCREDCKGICPICAGNRNYTSCNCRLQALDDRWAALRNL
ncbi:MAG: DUF177 domain-containing protein [Bryobacteraceae bacterium]|nr:DUF177 domain-containing protein [Bryobacteraceae bacterium]MDW8378395.1 DUF177 domain-containing protein [Bryobacterales bacterium]